MNLKQEMEEESKTEQNEMFKMLERNQVQTEQTSVASVELTSVDENDPGSETLPFVPSLSEVNRSSSNQNLPFDFQKQKGAVPTGSRPNRARQLPSRFDVIPNGQSNEAPTSPSAPSNLTMDLGNLGDNEAHVYSMIYQHLHANISNGNAGNASLPGLGTPNGLNRQFSPLVGFSAEKNMEHGGIESIGSYLPNNVASDSNREEENANSAPLLPPLGVQNGQVIDSRTLNHPPTHSQDLQQQQQQYFNSSSNLDMYSQQMPMQLMSFGPYGLQPIFASSMNHMQMPHLQTMPSIHPTLEEKNRNTASATTASSSSKKRKAPDPNKKPRKPQKRFMNSNDANGDFGAKRDGNTRLTTNQPRKVEVLDMNYNRLHLFESCSEASRVMDVNRTRISRVCRAGGGELSGKIYRYTEAISNVEPTTEVVAPVVDPIVSSTTEENEPPPLPPVVEYIPLEPTATDEHERDVLEEVAVDDGDEENLFV